MQDIQTHARGAKFSTYYNPPNHPQSSSSCARHDQHKQHSILPDHHTNQLQVRTDCTALSLSLSLSLFVSLFRVYNKHYILLSSCKALLVLLPATTLLLLVLLPATPLLLVLLPATSLVVVLFPATTLLLLLLLPATTLLVLVLVLLPATTNPLLLVLQLLQSKRDSSK
jgi:hypothetical protein